MNLLPIFSEAIDSFHNHFMDAKIVEATLDYIALLELFRKIRDESAESSETLEKLAGSMKITAENWFKLADSTVEEFQKSFDDSSLETLSYFILVFLEESGIREDMPERTDKTSFMIIFALIMKYRDDLKSALDEQDLIASIMILKKLDFLFKRIAPIAERLDDAQSHLHEIERIYKSLGEMRKKTIDLRGVYRMRMARSFISSGDYKEALLNLKLAYSNFKDAEQYIKMEDAKKQYLELAVNWADGLIKEADLIKERGDYRAAFYNYQIAMKILRKLNAKDRIEALRRKIEDFNREMGENLYNTAKRVKGKGLNELLREKEILDEAEYYLSQSSEKTLLKKIRERREKVRESIIKAFYDEIDKAKAKNDKEREYLFLEYLYEYYYKSGNVKMARKLSKRMEKLYNSVDHRRVKLMEENLLKVDGNENGIDNPSGINAVNGETYFTATGSGAIGSGTGDIAAATTVPRFNPMSSEDGYPGLGQIDNNPVDPAETKTAIIGGSAGPDIARSGTFVHNFNPILSKKTYFVNEDPMMDTMNPHPVFLNKSGPRQIKDTLGNLIKKFNMGLFLSDEEISYLQEFGINLREEKDFYYKYGKPNFQYYLVETQMGNPKVLFIPTKSFTKKNVFLGYIASQIDIFFPGTMMWAEIPRILSSHINFAISSPAWNDLFFFKDETTFGEYLHFLQAIRNYMMGLSLREISKDINSSLIEAYIDLTTGKLKDTLAAMKNLDLLWQILREGYPIDLNLFLTGFYFLERHNILLAALFWSLLHTY